ncbi:MAG: hypothetical protein QW304_08750 [Thermoproteota archaeon]
MVVIKAIETSPDEWPTEVWVALDEEYTPKFVEFYSSNHYLVVDGKVYNKPFGWGDSPEEATEDLRATLSSLARQRARETEQGEQHD